MSTTFEVKHPGLKQVLILGFIIGSMLAAQAQPVVIADSASAAGRTPRLLQPSRAAETPVFDTTFYQYWNDQFPSVIVARAGGLIPEAPVEIPRHRSDTGWQFWFVVTLLALLALIRFNYSKDFLEMADTFRNWGLNQNVLRELGVGVPFGVVLLNIFAALSMGFLVFLIIRFYGVYSVEPSWILMVLATGMVSVLLVGRYLLLKTAELFFPFYKELRLYNYYEIQANRLGGVAIYPLLILLAFSPEPVNRYALYAAFATVLILLLIRYVKGFNLGAAYFSGHLLHFLLYICALEIAPILLIIRLLLNLSQVPFTS